MPKKTKPPAARGTKKPAQPSTRTARPTAPRKPDHSLHTQIRGGRPPRFPGRTGGR